MFQECVVEIHASLNIKIYSSECSVVIILYTLLLNDVIAMRYNIEEKY